MKIVSSKEVYKCRVFRVTEDGADDGKGFHIERSVVRHPGSAVMLAVDDDKRVLLVRQYRLPAGKRMWELPAGTIDPGESVARTARRELAEEAGVHAKKWKKLTTFYPSPGCMAEKMTVFLATGLTLGEPKPMPDERIETRWFSRKELKEMIAKNRIADAKTMIGYLFLVKTGLG
jgi:ADP-ribose pyrophosphatase